MLATHTMVSFSPIGLINMAVVSYNTFHVQMSITASIS